MMVATYFTDRWQTGLAAYDGWNLRNSSFLAHKLRAAESKAGELPWVQGQLALCNKNLTQERRRNASRQARERWEYLTRSSGRWEEVVSSPACLSPPARKNLIKPQLALLRNRTVATVHCVSCWTGPSVPDTGLLPASLAFFDPPPHLGCIPQVSLSFPSIRQFSKYLWILSSMLIAV